MHMLYLARTSSYESVYIAGSKYGGGSTVDDALSSALTRVVGSETNVIMAVNVVAKMRRDRLAMLYGVLRYSGEL